MAQRIIFHVDLDAFFSSVEQIDHPEYRGKPVIVGALPGHRGVVSTCSYEAREYGVRSAMPVSKAWELCPNGIYVVPRMKRYQELSRIVMKELEQFSPLVRQMSVDEAYLDMTGMEHLFGPPEASASELKKRIHRLTGLTVSVGIAPNHYLAKLASDYRKPDGLFRITEAEVDSFIENLPLKKLHGVGAKTRERLEFHGIETVKELRRYSKEALVQIMGEGAADFLYAASRGQADYNPYREAQSHSLSSETTFEEDTADENTLRTTLLALCQDVSFRARSEGWQSHTVHVKLRWSDFSTTSAQETLSRSIESSSQLFQCAWKLVEKRWVDRKTIRLIGVGLAKLEERDPSHQNSLFETEIEKQGKVEQAIVALQKKSGSKVEITKASLLGKKNRWTEHES